MMSEKQALPKAFAAEALSLDRESVGDLFDILVKRVVSHALVFRSASGVSGVCFFMYGKGYEELRIMYNKLRKLKIA